MTALIEENNEFGDIHLLELEEYNSVMPQFILVR